MIEISEAKVGMLVAVEHGDFIVPGVIMAIDPKTSEVGVRRVFSDAMEIFPAEKVHTRYPRPNGHSQPSFPTSYKDKILLRLLGGFIIAISQGQQDPVIIKQVADEIIRLGIANQVTRAQEVISNLR